MSIFRRKLEFQDAAFEELSQMLWMEEETPTHKRELLDHSALDFSIDSLAQIDNYLDAIRGDALAGQDLLRVVLRCGAYVGEVIRRHSHIEYHWIDYDQASRESKIVKEVGRYLGTIGILRAGPDSMCFPLGKICKFIENGREDSVQFFAKAIIEGIKAAGPG